MTGDDPYDLTSSGEYKVVIAMWHVLDICIGPTEAEIRVQLATEEEQAATSSQAISLHAISPSGMIATLLDIEEQQYVYSDNSIHSLTIVPF